MDRFFHPGQEVGHSTVEMKHLVSQQQKLSSEKLLLMKTLLCF